MGRSWSSRAPGPARRRSSSSGSVPARDTRRACCRSSILVLTYNVKAARGAPGAARRRRSAPATRARMTVSNFHSFCQRILTENAADAGLPPRPDVLDGVAQVLLLRDIRPQLAPRLPRHRVVARRRSSSSSTGPRTSSSRPADFDAFVAEERRVFEARYGSFEAAADRLALQGNLTPLREVRGAYAGRPRERARRGARRGPRLRRRRRRRRPPTARPAARSPARRRRTAAASSPPTTTRASTRSPRPTSSTAPPSRSCA